MILLSAYQKSPRLNEKTELNNLLLGIAGGDKEAFGELYKKYYLRIYAFVLSYLKNMAESEEVSHDVFITLWEKAKKYSPGGSPYAYILTVAKNQALMRLRTQSHSEDVTDEKWINLPVPETVSMEDKIVLRDALALLSDEERRIVLLHAVTGLKHRETAELTDMSLSAVLSKYNRAIKKLKAFMEENNK